MGKSTHFIGQPLLRQIINFLDKDKVLRLSRKHGGERYVKRFDGWQHLVVMLYAVIMRFDSLREIAIATLAEARKLAHLGVTTMPRRSTLSDANARRPEAFFEDVYRDLYATHRQKLLSDSNNIKSVFLQRCFLILRSQRLAAYGNVQTNSKIKDFNSIHDEKNKFISCGGGSVVRRAVILQQRQQL